MSIAQTRAGVNTAEEQTENVWESNGGGTWHHSDVIQNRRLAESRTLYLRLACMPCEGGHRNVDDDEAQTFLGAASLPQLPTDWE